MADEATYQQQGEMPGSAFGTAFEAPQEMTPDGVAMPTQIAGAVPGEAYDAEPQAAYDTAYQTGYDAGSDIAYGTNDMAAAGMQSVPANADLGSTMGMEHVPLQVQLEGLPGEDYAPTQAETPIPVAAPLPSQAYAAQEPYAVSTPAAEMMPPQDPVKVKTITVRTGRLVCDVEIPDARFRYSTPRLAAFANGQYPDLPHHACVNDEGMTFASVMEKTSVAHLLEHLTISEQVRSQASGNAVFMGTTEWVDEATGHARVEVGFKDDLVALRAFNDATRFLNMAVLTCLA